MDTKYTYLTLSLLFFLPWFISYIRCPKSLRYLQLLGSIVGLAIALPAQLLYIRDWWMPDTITGTSIGLEDFIFGFFSGGVLTIGIKAFILRDYEWVSISNSILRKIIAIISVGFITMCLCMFVLRLNSFVATIVTTTVISIILLYKRADLVSWYISGAIYSLIVAFIFYSILNYFFPAWVYEVYFLKNVPSHIYFGLSIDDIVWYLTVGGMFSITYESISGLYFNKKKFAFNRIQQ